MIFVLTVENFLVISYLVNHQICNASVIDCWLQVVFYTTDMKAIVNLKVDVWLVKFVSTRNAMIMHAFW